MRLDSTNEKISYILFDEQAPSINLVCKDLETAAPLCTKIEGQLKRFEFSRLREARKDRPLRINIINEGKCIIMSGTLLSIKDCIFSNDLISTKTSFELGDIIADFNAKLYDQSKTFNNPEKTTASSPYSPTIFKTPTTCREDTSDVGKENIQLPHTKTK